MTLVSPKPSRRANAALLPKLAPLTQWHLLELAFAGMRADGAAALAPVLAATAAFVLLGQVWCLCWAVAILATVLNGRAVAAAFDLHTADESVGIWARRYATATWYQAAAVGAGGLGIAGQSDAASCLVVALPIIVAIAVAGASAMLAPCVRAQLILLTAPLAFAALSHLNLGFAVIGGLVAIQGMAASSLAEAATAQAERLARAETNRPQETLHGSTALTPAAVDFQRLLGRDQTTGLPNRHCFMHLLAEESARACRAESPLSLLLVAWDGYESFRTANAERDVHHTVAAIAKRLRATLKRPGDLLASLGNGRFAVLLAYTDAFGASTVARNVQTALRTAELSQDGADDLPAVALSIGAATYCGRGLLPESQLLQFAEEALRHAVRAGGDLIRRYDPMSATLHPPPYLGLPAQQKSFPFAADADVTDERAEGEAPTTEDETATDRQVTAEDTPSIETAAF
ncbi:MAG TPA: GGDEF domain-containing protein [Acetobacteraceae bacterium]|nr:GGDEF domain-containing protein [Acetobacteraceae bacterium]